MNYYVYNRPANTISYETPARFTWMPVEGKETYKIEVYDKTGECRYQFEEIQFNFFTPDQVMEVGDYTYSVFAEGEEIVVKEPFSIAAEAVATPLAKRSERYKGIGAHPRIWLNEKDILSLKERKDDELKDEWAAFQKSGVMPWLNQEVHSEPLPYPENKRVISLWRKMYMDCQEALYAVKHCSVAFRVTGEECYLEAAKKWLLAIAGWDTQGPTARFYNDESAFRVTTALAWGYDWLYDYLTAKEKQVVKATLLTRGRELYDYVYNQIQIHIRLLDSHGVRSLSMTLIPAALALYGEEDEAREWLNYTIEYFFTIFTPWGGADGGWAEGPTYWQSGVSFFTEAISLIRKATGIDVFKRPFFTNTGNFVLNTYCQDLRFMAFGDMSDLGDYPGLKAGYTMRILSAATALPERGKYAWYFDRAKERGKGTEGLFYNYGWWNFDFDELFFRMLFQQTEPEAPKAGLSVKWFRDIGWVCIHKDMAEEDKHIAFMFKSSPYGAVSHSHGDQNAFVLHAYGEPLAIQSGYYVGFWSEMHTKWRRHTKSKNAVLVDGKGQHAQLYKTTAAEDLNGSAKSQFESLIAANGRIEACEQKEGFVYLRGDATAAFEQSVPYVKENKRHVLFVDESLFVIIDEIRLAQAGSVQWLLHGLNKFAIGDNQFSSSHNGVGLQVMFAGAGMEIIQTDDFADVNPAEIAGLAPQWHVQAATRIESLAHCIVSVLYPYREAEKKVLTVSSGDEIQVQLGGKEYKIIKNGGEYSVVS